MIKHAVDQIKSATGIKTEKNLTKKLILGSSLSTFLFKTPPHVKLAILGFYTG